MNWENFFDWYLKKAWGRRAAEVNQQFRRTTPIVHLQPDLKEIKLAYDVRGNLNLADVKPTGLLVQSKG